ncbi:hypothetical protein OG897_34070 [Streptomyces sp. NBC_00237]|uniref:hypothetical protein n=1 Tax=Streptomyces sp. NBC_00237 TaxID=2975687 RepID=UPI00224F1381|nr:hypothetical protein [Streptomyces sp. NBC_00237]MCX5206423.1 hypothetical protein [Streptomyces sp. NBC_00237]
MTRRTETAAPFRPSLRRTINSVADTPRWAFAFHRLHALPLTALGLVAATERFFSRLYDDLPRLPLEALTLTSRVVLVGYVIHLAIRKDPEVAFGRGEAVVPKRHPTTTADFLPYLLGQGVLLGAATLLFNHLPENVLVAYVPEADRPLYFACLLAAKNLTVIPFTLIWMTGIARRQLLRAEPE